MNVYTGEIWLCIKFFVKDENLSSISMFDIRSPDPEAVYTELVYDQLHKISKLVSGCSEKKQIAKIRCPKR